MNQIENFASAFDSILSSDCTKNGTLANDMITIFEGRLESYWLEYILPFKNNVTDIGENHWWITPPKPPPIPVEPDDGYGYY